MTDPIRELKTRAELLHRRLRRGDQRAIARLRSLPEPAAGVLQRRHCLALIARELGFDGWPHARAVIAGAREVSDFGTLLCPPRCGGHLNLWFRTHREAVVGRQAAGGYLLAYRRHVVVVDRFFIETLGLDPDDRDWVRLGFDWVRPREMPARTRLYGALIARLPREAE